MCKASFLSGGFSCVCPIGSSSCDKPCFSSPCHNGGFCSNTQDGNNYTCACLPGFTGRHCETDNIKLCDSSPCPCLNLTCTCPPGYTGRHCESGIPRPCDSNPCSNNSVCNNTQGDRNYNCTCSPGYTGRHCDTLKQILCEENGCQNNGTCFWNDTDYGCMCVSGFTGSRCETPLECLTYRNLSEADRNVNASYIGILCDGYLITSANWYRFVGEAGTHMVDYCPMEEQHCNADFQVWLVDGQPKRGDIRVGLKYNIRGNNICNNWPGTIYATHCDTFIVYQLIQMNCFVRYCGAD
ncbi:protein crumbs homolog 1 [Nematostella vectensis]|uniref:protein crumbs homolog 1 n=1 Tax=Nematostella vectensis TaxID=45351 RepID=UPI00207745F8|nr:protein crumbs homolog 1 [Nematostella vectensis]